MTTRFVDTDRDTPLLLPVDLREWVPPNHLVHVILDAVDKLDLRQCRINTRGTGDAQYPPAMLLALLVYSYATGVFGARRIEQSTYDNIAVRLLTADTHPDHDTICAFRRENKALFTEGLRRMDTGVPRVQRATAAYASLRHQTGCGRLNDAVLRLPIALSDANDGLCSRAARN